MDGRDGKIQGARRTAQHFQSFDLNESGSLEPDELAAFLRDQVRPVLPF